MLVGHLSYAQKPALSGYLGRTTIASLKYYTGIRTRHPEKWMPASEATETNYSGISFKSELELSVGRALSNRFMVEGIIGHNTLSMNIGRFGGAILFTDVDGGQRTYSYYYGLPKITDNYVGMGVKFYRRKKGALAPIGVYYGVKSNYHIYTAHLTNLVGGVWTGRRSTDPLTPIEFGKFDYRFVEISATVGVTRAFKERFIVDYGLSMGSGFRASSFHYEEIVGNFGRDFRNMIKTYHLGKVYVAVGYLF